MTREELIGNSAMYGGAVTSCVTANAAYVDESMILMSFSGVSALVAILGFIFMVWDRNRQYKLSLEQYRLDRDEYLRSIGSIPPSALVRTEVKDENS